MQERHRNISTRRKLAGAVTLGAVFMFAGTGCQRHLAAPPPDAVVPPPPSDDAMVRRDWQESNAICANTSTVAGNTGFMFMPKWGQSEWVYPLLDTPLFLANVVTLPYSFFVTPAWKPVEYRSATIPPTYTGMPPLPPEPQRSESQENDLTQPPAPPSPEAQPMNAIPNQTPVPATTVPPDRPAQPMNEATEALP